MVPPHLGPDIPELPRSDAEPTHVGGAQIPVCPLIGIDLNTEPLPVWIRTCLNRRKNGNRRTLPRPSRVRLRFPIWSCFAPRSMPAGWAYGHGICDPIG